MCGIGAIIGKGWKPKHLAAMGAALKHRGPDDDAVVHDTSMDVGLAHTRLAIIDLDSRAKQPMLSHDEMTTIVFNGEIYNYQELRSELSDYVYRSLSDTEVILAAYSKWGEDCVHRLRGMFSFVIWDRANSKLFCARDRFGIKQLYFCASSERLYLASEIKGIIAAGIEPKPNNQAWADYLVHGYSDHTDQTFFQGIYGLKAGHTLTIDVLTSDLTGPKCTFSRYYDLRSHTQIEKPLDDDATIRDFRRKFYESIHHHMRSDVPVAISLSEGLDSNALYHAVSMINKESPISATFNFDNPPEGRFVEESAAMMRYMEAPYGGISTLAYAGLHAKVALSGIKVVLEGQCADELFGGYAYYQMPGDNLYQDGTKHLRVSDIDPEITAMANYIPIEPVYSDELKNRCYHDLIHTKVPRVLRMNDRLSMAFGVELRVPYLDHPLVEFAFSLASDYRIRDGVGKWILREAMKGIVPDDIRTAPKIADATPQRQWLREPIWKEFIGDTIHSKDFDRGFFDIPQVRSLFQDFCKKGSDNSFFVWQWVMVDMWFRTFIDNQVLEEIPVG